MKPMRLLLLIVCLLVGMAACTGVAEPTATAVAVVSPTPTASSTPTLTPTPVPTDTPSPTPSHTPEPTNTATPTATSTPSPTPLPEIVLDDPLTVTSGGFSMQPVEGYEAEVFEDVGANASTGLMSLSGEEDTILIYVIGVPDARAFMSGKSALDMLDELVADFIGQINGEYELGESFSMMVEDQEGTAVDVNGTLFDRPFIGHAVFLNPSASQAFFAIAIAIDAEIWRTRGKPAFAAMMESVQFLPPPAGGEGASSGSDGSSPCVISTDPTYGKTEANAIQTGGGAFAGPPRERAYLDNLLGPNGEKTSYERVGSVVYEDTILDIYEVTYGSTTVMLYLDEYNWQKPQAPVGFTCAAPFSLSAP